MKKWGTKRYVIPCNPNERDLKKHATEHYDKYSGAYFARMRNYIRSSGLPVKAKIQCTQPCTTDFSENMGYPTEEMANATAQ